MPNFQVVQDQMQRIFQCPKAPQRMVSLVPSQTEWLFSLGLQEQIVGVTWFCEHPAEALKQKTPVGGTKNVKLDRVENLAPDLIIANKEENQRDQILDLARQFPVWVSDVSDLNTALEMMRMTAQVTGRGVQGARLVSRIEKGFSELEPSEHPPRVLYLIWRKPWMSVGRDTFIHDMLSRGGWQNVCSGYERYPELDEAAIRQLDPDWIFLSSEPFPFKEAHRKELEALCPKAKTTLVDGGYFSWYGSRLLGTPDYFRQLWRRLRQTTAPVS